MIDVYYWPTPNEHKITIFLEETGLPYQIKTVNIAKGEQFKPEFLVVSPNNKIPAIVDHEPQSGGEPLSIFESGAILLYLADKTGKFLPGEERKRQDVMKWLFWQVASLGPMAGQNLDDTPNIKRWMNEMAHRPAVVRALAKGKDVS